MDNAEICSVEIAAALSLSHDLVKSASEKIGVEVLFSRTEWVRRRSLLKGAPPTVSLEVAIWMDIENANALIKKLEGWKRMGKVKRKEEDDSIIWP